MSTHPSLRDALGDYLVLRRALGFKLASGGRLLGQFVDHLNERGVGIPPSMTHLPGRPARPRSGDWRAIRLSVVRGFALYLHSLDVTVEVPSADLIRHGPDRATPTCIPKPRSVGSSWQPASCDPGYGRQHTRP
jgi:integrase/recombinase XerD